MLKLGWNSTLGPLGASDLGSSTLVRPNTSESSHLGQRETLRRCRHSRHLMLSSRLEMHPPPALRKLWKRGWCWQRLSRRSGMSRERLRTRPGLRVCLSSCLLVRSCCKSVCHNSSSGAVAPTTCTRRERLLHRRHVQGENDCKSQFALCLLLPQGLQQFLSFAMCAERVC